MENSAVQRVKDRVEEVKRHAEQSQAIAHQLWKEREAQDSELVAHTDVAEFVKRLAKHTFSNTIKAHGATKRTAYKKYFNQFKKDFYSMKVANRQSVIRQGLYTLGDITKRKPQGVIVNGKVIPANVGKVDG